MQLTVLQQPLVLLGRHRCYKRLVSSLPTACTGVLGVKSTSRTYLRKVSLALILDGFGCVRFLLRTCFLLTHNGGLGLHNILRSTSHHSTLQHG
jgi:hypothetical protein